MPGILAFGDAQYHIPVAQCGLLHEGSEETIPPRQHGAKITVGFDQIDGVMHPMDIGGAEYAPQHTIQSSGDGDIAVHPESLCSETDFKKDQCKYWWPDEGKTA